jgi:tetratricopeptide (TPR) repeat protein
MRRRVLSLWPIALSLTLLSAGAARQPEALIRQGNAAFEQGAYENALKLYEAAEERATDPGFVAFNEGAALYRAGRYQEAELHFRRALEGASGPRYVHAQYNRGNCLLRQAAGSDITAITEAMRCYEACLVHAAADGELKSWAAHNLELARLLWQQARKTSEESPPKQPESGDNAPSGDNRDKQGPRNPLGDAEPGSNGKVGTSGHPEQVGAKNAIETSEQTPGKGNLRPLLDRDELTPLTPEETAAHLEQAARRIVREQREYRQSAVSPAPSVKDW